MEISSEVLLLSEEEKNINPIKYFNNNKIIKIHK